MNEIIKIWASLKKRGVILQEAVPLNWDILVSYTLYASLLFYILLFLMHFLEAFSIQYLILINMGLKNFALMAVLHISYLPLLSLAFSLFMCPNQARILDFLRGGDKIL